MTHLRKMMLEELQRRNYAQNTARTYIPRGFTRIRHFGLLANRRRRELVALCRRLLGDVKTSTAEPPSSRSQLWSCPMCDGPMVVVEKLSAVQIRLGPVRLASFADTS